MADLIAESIWKIIGATQGEDTTREGLQETAQRFSKAWGQWTAGYRDDPAQYFKTFQDNVGDCNQMVLVKDINVYSTCEHHLATFWGKAHVAYIPDKRVIGLSKIPRVVNVFARRLQVQERLTTQIADVMMKHLQPQGVAVLLQCRHMCMESRGICQPGTETTTSAMRGAFLNEIATRAEFMNLIRK